MKTTLLLLALLPALALAQAAPEAPAPAAAAKAAVHAMIHAANTPWGDAPPALPEGAQAAVLHGDPSKAAPFALRLKMPAGYRVPRHWHPADEQVTLVAGDLTLSMGEAATAHAQTLGAGDYVNLPARMQHEASTKSGAVVQINAMGPFEITYVDPEDDPRKAAD